MMELDGISGLLRAFTPPLLRNTWPAGVLAVDATYRVPLSNLYV